MLMMMKKMMKKMMGRTCCTICLLASAESLSCGGHARVGVVTSDKNRVRFRRQSCGIFFL